MSRTRLCVALVLWMLMAVDCGQPPTQHAPVLLRLSGSTSMQGLLHDLAAAYSERHRHVAFELTAVGSKAGIETVLRGDADLALISRELEQQEEHDVATGERRLAYTVVAWDGIAVVVNESNPVRELTLYQLRNVFEGQITNWEELGHAAQGIIVVSREDGSGSRATFEELVMRGRRVTPTAVVMPSSDAVRDYVAAHKGTIGYLSLGCVGPSVAVLAVDNVRPERQTVEQAAYLITRPFLLASLAAPEPEAAKFMQFVRSLSGQRIVRRTHAGARSGSPR